MDENRFNQNFNSIYQYQHPYPSNINITVNNGSQNQPYINTNASDEIKKLYDLKEKGIITQDEFELKKKILL